MVMNPAIDGNLATNISSPYRSEARWLRELRSRASEFETMDCAKAVEYLDKLLVKTKWRSLRDIKVWANNWIFSINLIEIATGGRKLPTLDFPIRSFIGDKLLESIEYPDTIEKADIRLEVLKCLGLYGLEISQDLQTYLRALISKSSYPHSLLSEYLDLILNKKSVSPKDVLLRKRKQKEVSQYFQLNCWQWQELTVFYHNHGHTEIWVNFLRSFSPFTVTKPEFCEEEYNKYLQYF